MKCSKCNGSGRVEITYKSPLGQEYEMPAFCPVCNGTGTVKLTNFQTVTASPEALAEWLDNTFDYCQAVWYWQCDKCTWSKKNESCIGDKEKWLEWLNQEWKDESET